MWNILPLIEPCGTALSLPSTPCPTSTPSLLPPIRIYAVSCWRLFMLLALKYGVAKSLQRTRKKRKSEGSTAVSPRHCPATCALRNCCFNCRAGQSHKDNVRCTAVEEQPEAKEVQLSQPSSTSLLMISSGLT